MHGAPASRYDVAEEEINLSSETRPPPNPFRDNNSKSSSVDHENNTLEFEYVQHDSIEHERKTNTGGTFELVPLSEDDNNVEMADFDDEEDRRHSSSCAPFSGDDYHTSGTMLPQKLYQYIYPPDVPRTVQLFRTENIAGELFKLTNMILILNHAVLRVLNIISQCQHVTFSWVCCRDYPVRLPTSIH